MKTAEKRRENYEVEKTLTSDRQESEREIGNVRTGKFLKKYWGNFSEVKNRTL